MMTADVSLIKKSTLHKVTFILNVLSENEFIFVWMICFLDQKITLISQKRIF